MAGVIAIAGIVVPAVVAFVAPAFVEFIKKKMNERKESVADIHEVLEKGLKELLAFQNDPSKLYKLSKTQVSNIEKRVTSLDEEYKQVKEKKRSHGKNRDYHVKEEIKGALKEVIGLLEKCKDMNVERVIKENGVPSIENYQTLQKAFQKIQDLLQNGENSVSLHGQKGILLPKRIKCVSLHGQKGVGKTTIMQHLNNHFLDRADFDMVIFIKVAADEQTNDLHILQKIADRMKVDRESKSEVEVARRILKVLQDKRYLLILDGVRQAIDGIWNNLDISEDEKDSKVVIATHYHLAWKSACVQTHVQLEKLTSNDAWKMFRDIVGANLLPDIQSKARLVCQKFSCCLPLLIYPIAWSFKNGAPTNWGTPFPQLGVDGVKEIYSFLETCYERLGDESKQKCFLYSSLYPANSNICIHQLVECCIVQGFLGRVDPDTKYSEMRSRAKDEILSELVKVAFLEEVQQMRYVKMSDLYRQLALYISSKEANSECRIYVDNEEHKEPFRSTSWEDAKWVSMVDSGRDSLPISQNYGSLQTLLLRKNLRLVKIPTTYFDSMGNLLVLNLNGTKIRRLPSLLRVTNLKVFYLNDCSDLVISPSDAETLEHLVVFDVRGTLVNFVPDWKNLRCLRISYITIDIYHGILELPKLEELTFEGCNKMSNANAINNTPENAGLHLEQLHLDNSQQGIIYFKGPLHRGSLSTLHTLTLKNSSIVFSVAADDFPELQNLIIQNCSRFEVLIQVTEGGESIVSKLKMLILDNLSDIKSICSNENLAWSSLEKLHVRKCPELKRLPSNITKATNLSTIEGEEEWWSNLVCTDEDLGQLESSFSAFT